MKKFIVAMVAALMAASGLVAASGSTASAAPYPGTVGTDTSAAALPAPPHQARIRVGIDGDRGRPKGKLVFTFIRKPGNHTVEFKRTYTGHDDTFRFTELRPGRYVVVISYVPDDNAQWEPSTSRTRTRVDG